MNSNKLNYRLKISGNKLKRVFFNLKSFHIILPTISNFSVLAILFIASTGLYASPTTVIAKADTTQIRIGEQFHLKLSATFSQGTKITFPLLTDTFNHFEVVNKSTIDTISPKESNDLTLQQQLTITCFDSGYFVLPPMPFVVNQSDTMLTEAMLIGVLTIPVDTTKEIRSIKGIIDVPFPWLQLILIILAACAVVGLIIWLIFRFRKKESIIFKAKVPERPAHEIALENLKRIDDEKIWQAGMTKKYYSEVTDTLRQYIEKRFSVFAMELTTDEILHHFSNGMAREEEIEKLKFILKLADMIKFAKGLALPAENERAMQYAIDFINNTRPVIKEDFEKAEVAK